MLIFSSNDAKIAIWEEINGEKNGNVLVDELLFVQNVSLETTFQEITIPQIGYDETETEIVGRSHDLKGELLRYFSKEDADSLSDTNKLYQIEIRLSPTEIYTLHSCRPIGTWIRIQASDNQIMKMQFAYRVKSFT